MVLVDDSGNRYWAHFRHVNTPEPGSLSTVFSSFRGPMRDHWTTECTIHKGKCQSSKKPCGTEAVQGLARCNPTDMFNRALGRKMAFHRAVDAFTSDRHLRSQLWNSYLRQSKLPKKRGR